MKNKKQTTFRAAMDVVRDKRLAGWSFRLFRRGAAEVSPVIILAPETPPTDPWATCRLVPVETCDSVYRALAGAPEAARGAGGAAFVCRVLPIANDLENWFSDAGAIQMDVVR
jgi:hypothetical protein